MIGALDARSTHDPRQDGEEWLVYGFVPASARLPDPLVGIADRPVVTHVHVEVAALASPVDLDRPLGRAADLIAYQAVLDAVAATGVAVAPVRFGAVLPDAEAVVTELVEPAVDDLAGLLADLTGRQQLVVQGVYEEQLLLSDIVARDPEIADLRRRTRDLPEDAGYPERVRLGELVARAVEEQQAVDARFVLDQLVPLVDDLAEREVSGLERAFDAALLVAEVRREELELRLERLAEELHPRLRLQLRGPMAPYDFVGGA